MMLNAFCHRRIKLNKRFSDDIFWGGYVKIKCKKSYIEQSPDFYIVTLKEIENIYLFFLSTIRYVI